MNFKYTIIHYYFKSHRHFVVRDGCCTLVDGWDFGVMGFWGDGVMG